MASNDITLDPSMSEPHDSAGADAPSDLHSSPTARESQNGSDSSEPTRAAGVSRRSFLKGASGVAAATSVLGPVKGSAAQDSGAGAIASMAGTAKIELMVNGEKTEVEVEPRTTLLSALRTRMEPALTGTKLVCDTGSCGACTVLIDSKPAYACLTLAAQCRGKAIKTVEGFGTPDDLSDVQDSFCEKDGLMCGFCTPGFVVATHAALDRNPDADLDEIKYELSGNFCRCGTYPHVFDAAIEAQARRKKEAK